MCNVMITTEKLREELENLIELKGLNNAKVLELSQILDQYILKYYSKKY